MPRLPSDAAVLTPPPGLSGAYGPLTARSAGAMLLLALVWGLSIPVTKLGLGTIPPMTFTLLRYLVAVPLFLWIARKELRLPRRAIPGIAALGVIGITLGNAAQSLGVQGTSASLATILSTTIPIFMVLLAAIRFRQAVTPVQWSGLVAAFLGIALVAVGSGSGSDAGRTTGAGIAWMLVSAIAIAVYYIWSAELTETYGLKPVAAWNMVVGLVTLAPLSAWELSSQTVSFTPEAIGAIVYLGAFVTVAGMILWLYLMTVVPARIAASVQYLQPVFGISASALLFGDRLGLLFAAGVGLVLAGLGLAASGKRGT